MEVTSIGNNTYRVPVNFYKTDYYYSFGSAEMIIYKDVLTIKPIGFNDTWDLDFKGKNGRSKKAEIVTKVMYGIFGGENYKVVYT